MLNHIIVFALQILHARFDDHKPLTIWAYNGKLICSISP